MADFKFIKLISELGTAFGMKDLKFGSDDKSMLLQVDGEHDVGLARHEEEQQVVIYHRVGKLPDQNRCEVVEKLLEANLFWAGTRGATLSIEREEGNVLIARSFSPHALDGNALAQAIIDLVDIAKYWSALLEKGVVPQEGVKPKKPLDSGVPTSPSSQVPPVMIDTSMFA